MGARISKKSFMVVNIVTDKEKARREVLLRALLQKAINDESITYKQ